MILLIIVLSVTGCGKKDDSDRLAKIKDAGKIVIAMEGQWAPWTYHDESGALVGFDTKVGKAIAAKLGVEAEFIEGEWDGLFVGLDSGKYDLIINGVEINDERKQKYDFTTPYAYDSTVLIVTKDNSEIKSFTDLKGRTTSNSLGSTYADLAADYGASVQNVDTLAETISMIISGRAEATLNSETSFYDYMKEHPDENIMIVDKTPEAAQIAIPIVKGDNAKALIDAINKAIDELRKDGTLQKLSEKYFGGDITSAR